MRNDNSREGTSMQVGAELDLPVLTMDEVAFAVDPRHPSLWRRSQPCGEIGAEPKSHGSEK